MRPVLFALLAAARAAHADDLRDQFGLHKKPAEPPVACTEAPGSALEARHGGIETHTLGCVWHDDDLDAQSPYALATWLPASYLFALPVGDATHDQLAHYALGASRDETGPVFGSGNGLENRWTIDGSPIDNAQVGGVDTKLPLAFLDGMMITAGGFSARDRTSLGGTIDAQLLRGTPKLAFTERVWGTLSADARHRPDARATYQARKLLADPFGSIDGVFTATGPLPHDAWFAIGIGGQTARTELGATTSRLVDADGDQVPDLDGQGRYVLEPIAHETFATTTAASTALVRGGLDRGHHHFDVSLIGSRTGDTRFLALATDLASGVDRSTWVGDAIATYRGDFGDTRVKLQASWHRSAQYQRPHASSAIQTLSAYIPASLPEDPTLAAACADVANAKFIHCPIPLGLFASGGAGLLVDTIADRPSITADVTHRLGAHVVRAGVTGEDTRLVLASRFTGGEQIRSLFPGHVDEQRFFGTDCGANPTDLCDYKDTSTLSYRTRYTAAYVEDTVSPIKDLRIDGGLRWELMWVGTRLHFSNELAPRLGATWRLFDGHAKAWASLGRSFAMLPAGLGQTLLARNATVSDVSVAGLGNSRSIERGAAILVADGIQPLAQDEATIGFDAGLAKVAQLTLWAQGRAIERGLDTTPTGFDNPGTNGDLPAARNSLILAAQLWTTGNPSLRVGYQYGAAWGSWTGAYDPRQGAILYAGDAYDSGSVNLNGRLPSDQGHRVYLEGVRRGKLGDLPVSAALRVTVGSGRPRDVVADTSLGNYELLPRGDNGRGPLLTQANLQLAARWHAVDVTLDIFNLFDRHGATNLDQVYTQDAVRPISGGDARDLIWLRDVNGDPALRSRTYGLGTAFQAPVSATLGARYAF